jgi:hypothetical protein
MSKARDIANSTETLDVDGGTIKLDGNYPVGTGNVALGDAALDSNVSGASNTAIGSDALTANTASYNTAVGYRALYSNTTASNSTAVGSNTLDAVTTGNNNVAVGNSAGGAVTTGTDNTMMGVSCGELVTTGSKNTIIGRYNGNQGGLDIRTSSNNIVLSDGDGNPRFVIHGTSAISFGAQNGSNDIAGGTVGLALNGSDGLQLLDSRTNSSVSTYRYRFYNTNGLVGYISTGGSSTNFVTSSDYRLKENVVALTDATTRLKQLEPKRFNFIADADTTVDGFIAHEVQSIVPEAVTGEKDAVDADGNIAPQGIDQAKLVPLLVATIKELEARITALEAD